MQSDILRKKFLDFFKSKKHKIIESDSLIPRDDPTVLFTPAGMNQFKKEFMGYDAGYKRAATSQRCLRTDDLDKVGKTTGHHTFFEMLGNFSFGDYFKQEAISWAWEFLIKELRLNPEVLWVSVYEQDDEAYNIWKDKIGIPAQKLVKLGQKENFWPAAPAICASASRMSSAWRACPTPRAGGWAAPIRPACWGWTSGWGSRRARRRR